MYFNGCTCNGHIYQLVSFGMLWTEQICPTCVSHFCPKLIRHEKVVHNLLFYSCAKWIWSEWIQGHCTIYMCFLHLHVLKYLCLQEVWWIGQKKFSFKQTWPRELPSVTTYPNLHMYIDLMEPCENSIGVYHTLWNFPPRFYVYSRGSIKFPRSCWLFGKCK